MKIRVSALALAAATLPSIAHAQTGSAFVGGLGGPTFGIVTGSDFAVHAGVRVAPNLFSVRAVQSRGRIGLFGEAGVWFGHISANVDKAEILGIDFSSELQQEARLRYHVVPAGARRRFQPQHQQPDLD